MGVAVPFPETQPTGYEWFDGEPAFDPERHLRLEEPEEVVMLADLGYDRAEISRTADLIIVDDHESLWTEWAKTAAWRARGQLQSLIDELEFTSDRDAVIAALESAVGDVQRAIGEMRAGSRMTEHYGG